jgi:alkyldihydroxyacetonephosphate synthase
MSDRSTHAAHSLRSTIEGIVGAEHISLMAEPTNDPAQMLAQLAGAFYRVTPRTAAEIAEVFSICAKFKCPVHPVGSGRRPTQLGRDKDRVFVSTRRLNQVVQLDESSLLVHAQAGITGIELQKILVPRGLSMGDYPPAVLSSSLGGIIAVRTPGKSSARHGFLEDAVVGVSAVLANGKTVHTRVAPRRATGPDLLRALCGSEGTIGFITSVVMKIHRAPQARFLTAYTTPTVENAIAAVYLAMREEAAPAGIRIYDSAEVGAHFKTAVAIPPGAALIVIGTAGATDLAACDRDLVASAVKAEGGASADNSLAEIWWRRLHHGESTPAAPPTMQAMTTPSRLHATYQAVLTAVAAAGATARAHISRFDADGALIFFSVIRDGAVITPEPTDSHQRALLELAKRAATDAGGWLLGARSQRMDPYLLALQQELDPLGIMNPGGLT